MVGTGRALSHPPQAGEERDCYIKRPVPNWVTSRVGESCDGRLERKEENVHCNDNGNLSDKHPFLMSGLDGSHGIESVLEHQMSLAYENPLDGAFPKCIPPLIQILEGPAPSLGFSFGPFFRSLRQRSKGYRTGPFPYLSAGTVPSA